MLCGFIDIVFDLVVWTHHTACNNLSNGGSKTQKKKDLFLDLQKYRKLFNCICHSVLFFYGEHPLVGQNKWNCSKFSHNNELNGLKPNKRIETSITETKTVKWKKERTNTRTHDKDMRKVPNGRSVQCTQTHF